MRTSIIIATYNGATYLEDCLRALRQAAQPEDELILVDNASSDGSAELACSQWPGATVIRNTANAGFAAACNQGAAVAKGQFLVFLNQDTRVEPGWLNSLLNAFDHTPRVGLVTSKLLLMSQPDRIHMCGQAIHFTGLTFGRGFLLPSAACPNQAKVGAVSGASFAIRRELWQRLGGFDEGLFMYYEETDLSWRARLAGFDSLYTPCSLAYHDYRPAQPGDLALYYAMRNRMILLLKSFRWPTLLVISPSLLLAELLEWGRAAQIGRRGMVAKCKALAWLVAHPGRLLRARRRTQKSRLSSDLSLLQSCSAAITPREFTGGASGRVFIAACNGLFYLNARLARGFCRLFHL